MHISSQRSLPEKTALTSSCTIDNSPWRPFTAKFKQFLMHNFYHTNGNTLLNISIDKYYAQQRGHNLPLASISSLSTQSLCSHLLQLHCIHSLPVSISSWYKLKHVMQQWSASSPASASLRLFFETRVNRESLGLLRFVPDRDFSLSFTTIAASFAALAASLLAFASSLSAAHLAFSAAFSLCSSSSVSSLIPFQFFASPFLAVLASSSLPFLSISADTPCWSKHEHVLYFMFYSAGIHVH